MIQGASFRPSPELKAQRAISKAAELLGALVAWTQRGDIAIAYTAHPDQGILDEVLRVNSVPEIETFFYELGEALHQLRSSLDNFAFERAGSSGAPIENPRDIYFPIVSDPAKWNARTKPLSTVDPKELSRWRQLQPFNTAHPAGSPFAVLDRLQNRDKHRAPLVPQPLPATHGQLSFRLGEPLRHSQVDPTGMSIEFSESPELRDGELLARYRFGREVFLLPDTAAVVTDLSWFVLDSPHGRIDLFLLIDVLTSFVPDALTYMRRGGTAPAQPQLTHTSGRDGQFQVFGRPDAPQ